MIELGLATLSHFHENLKLHNFNSIEFNDRISTGFKQRNTFLNKRQTIRFWWVFTRVSRHRAGCSLSLSLSLEEISCFICRTRDDYPRTMPGV